MQDITIYIELSYCYTGTMSGGLSIDRISKGSAIVVQVRKVEIKIFI